ncbi:MAG TPA: FHA domain-containing protein [Phototrophicaceae bacterium]|jgi:pSer/pThr/pTyr-binding forkhead associated (FHA) protein|nr:FHA domain-containing protein [Phototrophicaceae bacterium]
MNTKIPAALAKLTWKHPDTGDSQEYVLVEGATVTIGRSSSNDIYIPEHHVSRQHAVINYRDGIFMLNDLSSANGTFVNDQPVTEAFPLASGDEIRLYVPLIHFFAADAESEVYINPDIQEPETVAVNPGGGRIIITNGPQEGETISLWQNEITIGRAVTNHTWEIGLLDPSVSRPHAKLIRVENRWVVQDLGSSNGTRVNNTPVTEKGRVLSDGDVVAFGGTIVLFRAT